MALTMASGGTSDGTKACQVGPLKANATPCPTVSAITANRVAWWSQARRASSAAATIMKLCVAIRMRRRSSRAVYTPPIGGSTVGVKLAKVTKDTQNADRVMRKTNQASATDCI